MVIDLTPEAGNRKLPLDERSDANGWSETECPIVRKYQRTRSEAARLQTKVKPTPQEPYPTETSIGRPTILLVVEIYYGSFRATVDTPKQCMLSMKTYSRGGWMSSGMVTQ